MFKGKYKAVLINYPNPTNKLDIINEANNTIFKTGKTTLEMLPAPVVKDGHILGKTSRSLVSLGTEKMLVEFGKASIIEKARQQPEKVKMVFDKIKTDGLLPTLETVFNKLEQPLLGYYNVGKIIGVGNGVKI